MEFRYTVVQVKNTYWADQVHSETLTLTSDSEAEAEPEGEAEPEAEKHADYEGCFSSKGCFGDSTDCVEKGDCKVLMTWDPLDDDAGFEFSLHGPATSDGQYLAFGLSDDDKMADDLVFACLGNDVDVAWNKPGRENVNGVTGVEVNSKKVVNEDGVKTCTFRVGKELNARVPGESSDRKFDLDAPNYHVLVARGSFSGDELQIHTSRAATGDKVDLTKTQKAEAKGDELIRAHGILMVLAWLTSASTGMFFARYMKETFRGRKIAGKDVWFPIHQLCMGSTVLLTVLGFILVSAEQGFLPYTPEQVKKNAHPVLGFVTMLLALIQPFMAAFRCHPGTPKRPVFDWAHWFVGNSAWILAIVTVFLAGELDAAGFIPTKDWYIRIGIFVLVHVLFHLIMTAQRFWAMSKNTVSSDEHEMAGKGINGSMMMGGFKEGSGDLKGSLFRKIMAFIYVLFVVVYGIHVCVLIGIGKPGRGYWTVEGEYGEAEGEAEAEAEN